MSADADGALLDVDGIDAYYGESHILQGLSTCIERPCRMWLSP